MSERERKKEKNGEWGENKQEGNGEVEEKREREREHEKRVHWTRFERSLMVLCVLIVCILICPTPGSAFSGQSTLNTINDIVKLHIYWTFISTKYR